MDDIFDELNSLEESEIERGRQEGYNDGLAMGLLEGRELGVQKGYELGMIMQIIRHQSMQCLTCLITCRCRGRFLLWLL